MKYLSDHILDIVNNSIRANATLIEIDITEDISNDIYSLTIKDNGDGMSQEEIQKAIDPFYTSRTYRKVGLGLPLLKQNTERTGGKFHIDSSPKNGTIIKSVFKHKNIDRPTIGNISETLIIIITGTPEIDIVYSHHINTKQFIFDTREIKKELGNISISNLEVRHFMQEMINENLELIDYTK